MIKEYKFYIHVGFPKSASTTIQRTNFFETFKNIIIFSLNLKSSYN